MSWPLDFSRGTRAELLACATPPAGGLPCCTVCGEPIGGPVAIHHRQRRGKGLGDGRPSNGLPVCGSGNEKDGCHGERIHQDPVTAQAMGWLISSYDTSRGRFAKPLLCARRGWIRLLDQPPFWEEAPVPERSWTPGDAGG